VSASDVIARLRELRAKATAGEWLAIKSPRHNHWKIGDGRSVYFDVCNFINIEHFAKWGTSGTAEDNAKYTAAAMNSLPALLECAEALEPLMRAYEDLLEDVRERIADPNGDCDDVETITALDPRYRKARAALLALSKTTGENQ